MIAHETGVANTVDPLGGSFYVEHLTAEIESLVREYLKRIDDLGGAVSAIEKGFPQREIHEAAYTWQKRVEAEEAVVVGVNRFVEKKEAQPPVLRIDKALERKATERLQALRSRRDRTRVAETLDAVERAAGSDDNLVPRVLDAVEAYATLGEITDRMRNVFGTWSSCLS